MKARNLPANLYASVTVYRGAFGEEAVALRGTGKNVEEAEINRWTQEHSDKDHSRLDEHGKDRAGIKLFDRVERCVIEIRIVKLSFW